MKRILAAVLCTALLLTGCQTQEAPYVPTGDALAPDGPETPTSPAVTQQALSLACHTDHSLNPLQCGDYTDRLLFGLVYQGLFAVDESYAPDPILCSSFRRSPDMLTYTFYLEPATFSDGTALTAADAAASLRAAMKSGYYGGRFSMVEEISTQEEAVVVTLATPCEDLPVLLDVPILKADQVSADRPLGTGPYYFEGETLRRRTDWWCTASIPVTTEKISLVEAGDPAQLRDTFEFSGLSMVVADPGDESYVDFHSDHELWDCDTGIFLYLGCNKDSYVLSKGDIRETLTYAIHREGLTDRFYRDFAQPVTLPADPDSPYYDQELAATVTYDPQRLTDAVAAVTMEPTELILLVNNDDGIRLRVARAIAEGLESCGLSVAVTALNGDDYRAALAAGEFDLYLGQTKLAANMDLSAFFKEEGSLSFGGIADEDTYAMCLDALANRGNAYTLYEEILESGDILPIAFRSYAIFTQRGAFTDLYPARDGVFYYTLGKDTEQIRTEAADAE